MSKSATVGEAEYVTAHEVINRNSVGRGRQKEKGMAADGSH